MNILILDDHPLFADALRQVLLRLGNHVVVHIAEDARHALAFIEAGKVYDLIFVDINLPGLDGFAFIRQLHGHFVTSPWVMISGSPDAEKRRMALQQGAMGYVHKSADARTVLTAVHEVLAGNIYFPDLSPSTPIHFDAGNARGSACSQPHDMGISGRQFDVLLLMEKGLSNKEIAGELDITESTVKIHVSKLIAALAVHNRIGCVMEAQRLGLL